MVNLNIDEIMEINRGLVGRFLSNDLFRNSFPNSIVKGDEYQNTQTTKRTFSINEFKDYFNNVIIPRTTNELLIEYQDKINQQLETDGYRKMFTDTPIERSTKYVCYRTGFLIHPIIEEQKDFNHDTKMKWVNIQFNIKKTKKEMSEATIENKTK